VPLEEFEVAEPILLRISRREAFCRDADSRLEGAVLGAPFLPAVPLTGRR
jgi:hypothetical protein